MNSSVGYTKSFDTTLTVNQIPSHNHNIVVDKPGYDVGLALYSANLVQQNSKYVDTNLSRPTGGGQGHSHDIPHIGVWVWKRIS